MQMTLVHHRRLHRGHQRKREFLNSNNGKLIEEQTLGSKMGGEGLGILVVHLSRLVLSKDRPRSVGRPSRLSVVLKWPHGVNP